MTEEVMQEEVPVIRSLPLRLSLCPEAIQQHFETDERVANLPRAKLLDVGEYVLEDDTFYEAFHEALCTALKELAGFDPDDRLTDDPNSTGSEADPP